MVRSDRVLEADGSFPPYNQQQCSVTKFLPLLFATVQIQYSVNCADLLVFLQSSAITAKMSKTGKKYFADMTLPITKIMSSGTKDRADRQKFKFSDSKSVVLIFRVAAGYAETSAIRYVSLHVTDSLQPNYLHTLHNDNINILHTKRLYQFSFGSKTTCYCLLNRLPAAPPTKKTITSRWYFHLLTLQNGQYGGCIHTFKSETKE